MAQANLDFMAGMLADPEWAETADTNPDAFAMESHRNSFGEIRRVE